MLTLMVISICYTLYGIAGLFGFQIIPEQYKGHPWTKEYKRSQGIAYLMLGVPWLLVCLLEKACLSDVPVWGMILIVALLAVPAFIFAVAIGRKYKALLENSDSKETEKDNLS